MFRFFFKQKSFSFLFLRKSLNYPISFDVTSLKELENLTEFFKRISTTSSRTIVISQLKTFLINYFQQSDKELTFNVIRILSGYTQKEKDPQIGPETLIDIVMKLFPVTREKIAQDLKIEGDIGLLVRDYMKKFNNHHLEIIKPLEIKEIFETYDKISRLNGKGSKQIKLDLLVALCRQCRTEEELLYLFRIFKKNLRLGCSYLTVLKSLETIQKEEIIPNFENFLTEMENEIFGFRMDFKKADIIKIGIPLNPMKGRPIDDISEIFTVFKKYDGKILCEIKYDGERAQIHYEKDKIFSFSRNFELQNEKYRNLLDKLKAHLQSQHIENCIIDCEIIGFDYSKLQMLSFQELMTKKENSIQLEGKIYCFDLYYLNSESLLDKNLIKRRNQLFSAFKSTDFFVPAEGFELDIKAIPQEESLLQINDFLADTLDQGYEGIFLKTLDEKLSVYMGNTRVQWIKLKKKMLCSELPDTLDLVPIAGFWGKGKRSGVIGTYLIAAYCPKRDVYEAVCKIGTGFSDEFLKKSTENLLEKTIESPTSNYLFGSNLKPDVWFEPSEVWEIVGDSFTLSSVYTIGKDNFDNKGVSLRFPRFLKLRTDKKIGEATEINHIIEFYRSQKSFK